MKIFVSAIEFYPGNKSHKTRFNLCDLLRRQNIVAKSNFQFRQGNLSLQRIAQLIFPPADKKCFVAATCSSAHYVQNFYFTGCCAVYLS